MGASVLNINIKHMRAFTHVNIKRVRAVEVSHPSTTEGVDLDKRTLGLQDMPAHFFQALHFCLQPCRHVGMHQRRHLVTHARLRGCAGGQVNGATGHAPLQLPAGVDGRRNLGAEVIKTDVGLVEIVA